MGSWSRDEMMMSASIILEDFLPKSIELKAFRSGINFPNGFLQSL
jgi:hypothetical protein